MTITLTLDIEQLGILMSGVEFMMDHPLRSEEQFAKEIESAARHWDMSDDRGFEYGIVKVGPVYIQLLKAWQATGWGPLATGVWLASSPEDFGNALAEAMAALAGCRLSPAQPSWAALLKSEADIILPLICDMVLGEMSCGRGIDRRDYAAVVAAWRAQRPQFTREYAEDRPESPPVDGERLRDHLDQLANILESVASRFGEEVRHG